MKNELTRFHIDFCPKCGRAVDCVPAISRIDSSWICSDCGTREALDSIGVCVEEQDQILEAIHQSGRTVAS